MKKNKNVIILIVVLLIAAAILGISILKNKKTLENEKVLSNINISLASSEQTQIDNSIKDDLKENEYSLNNAKVYLNPYGNSPLTAIVGFKTNEKGTIEVVVKGKNNNDLVTTYEATTYNYIPVYGLYPNYDNTIEIRFNGKTKTITIKTENMNDIEGKVISSSNKITNNDFFFATETLANSSYAVDKYGEIRWYATGYFHNIIPLENNHLLIGDSSFDLHGMSSNILEIDYLGRIYKKYTVDSGYLNDFFLKEDGNIILTSKNPDRETFSEYIIEIDSNSGKILKTIDVYELFKEIDNEYTSSLTRDFFFNSGIEYYEESKTLLLTYWAGEFVININYENGTINWILSNPNNFSSKFAPYLLNGGEDFTYPKSMHSAHLFNNTLKVFDNGYNINAGIGNPSDIIGLYSSANTYKIDNKSISLVKIYDEDKKLFSYALADYKTISNNDEIILFGRELENYDYNGNVNINEYIDLSSRIIEKIDGETAIDIKVNKASGTLEKIDISKGINFSFDEMKVINTPSKTEKTSLTDDIINKINSSELNIDYNMGFVNNVFEVNVSYMLNDEVSVIFMSNNNEGAIYNIKKSNDILKNKILVELPEGKYNVYFNENGIIYKTDKYIEVK